MQILPQLVYPVDKSLRTKYIVRFCNACHLIFRKTWKKWTIVCPAFLYLENTMISFLRIIMQYVPFFFFKSELFDQCWVSVTEDCCRELFWPGLTTALTCGHKQSYLPVDRLRCLCRRTTPEPVVGPMTSQLWLFLWIYSIRYDFPPVKQVSNQRML